MGTSPGPCSLDTGGSSTTIERLFINIELWHLYFTVNMKSHLWYEKVRKVRKNLEKLENTPKNKFRKIAKKDLELIFKEIETICQIKEFELNDYSMYLVNESFKKNEK